MKVSIIVLALLTALFAQSHAAFSTDETCGKDAGEFYRNKFENSFEKGTTSYRPYYNKALNHCFVSISIHGYRRNTVKIDSIYMVLYDLDSKKELGSFFQVYGDRSEQYPYCITLTKPVAKCTAEDWDAFILRYFQE